MISRLPRSLLLFSAALAAASASASDITVRLLDPPESGSVVMELYDSAESFLDMRQPFRSVRHDLAESPRLAIIGVPPGQYALLVYHDVNGNGRLDRNFIGIPTEPLGFSNNYAPKGPPVFPRAAFPHGEEPREFDVLLRRPLGERGRIAVGVGVLGRGSPYVDSNAQVIRVIPAIYYLGNRLQIVGPRAQIGLLNADRISLAATLAYQPGVYEEGDSPVLEGLGDRRDTLLVGAAAEWELPRGAELQLDYAHDALDRVGGGLAQLRLSRSFPAGVTRITPSLGVNWLSAEMGSDFYGVTARAATADRPAYRLSDSFSLEVGLGLFVEIATNWQAVLGTSVERLDREVTRSPIVGDEWLWKGFASVGRIF